MCGVSRSRAGSLEGKDSKVEESEIAAVIATPWENAEASSDACAAAVHCPADFA